MIERGMDGELDELYSKDLVSLLFFLSFFFIKEIMASFRQDYLFRVYFHEINWTKMD